MFRNRDSDTICAVSTPYGYGGVSIIRVSGPNAYSNVQKLSKNLPVAAESHRVYFTTLYEETNSKQNQIDEVLVTFFVTGRSFTGEEVVEISCHGNPLICERILTTLTAQGCRLADAGEFTYRAFLNGKIDLVQAESVLSLIESRSIKAQNLALRQLKGRVSDEILKIEDLIIWCLAHIEASIDFSTENLDVITDDKLKSTILTVKQLTESILDGYKQGRLIQDGVLVALVGAPNVGKSSLLNYFIEDDKAIVTNIAGTTRDLIEASYNYRGITFNFVDTAGLRTETQDVVEKIGISKTKDLTQNADIVAYVFDVSLGLSQQELEQIEILSKSKKIDIFLANKFDLVSQRNESEIRDDFYSNYPSFREQTIAVSSAKIPEFREAILNRIYSMAIGSRPLSENVISSARQFESLKFTLQSICKAIEEIDSQMGSEFIALSLKEALLKIQEVLGKSFDDQILDRVFKEFCLGK